jgi:hypothetical protein
VAQVTMAKQCPICGRLNADTAGPCACGYVLSARTGAKPTALGPRAVFLDLAVIVIGIAATGITVWAIAQVASEFHSGFLFLLVIVPWVGTLSFLLRRHCYPNTPVWRTGSISHLDPIPAPMGRKLYVTFLGAVHIVLGMLLVYVILSRAWYAAKFGAPATSLVYDVLHPWSVAPLYQTPIPAPTDGTNAGPPTRAPWWLFPVVGLVLSFVALGWCGTLETNTRRNLAVGTSQVYRSDLSWARVAAILALLLFWLPVIGLVAGVVAFWLNRHSSTWTFRASQLGLFLAGFVHAAITVVFVIAAMTG